MRSDSQSVPERYVDENNKDGSIVSQDSANSLQIPVIDFSFLAKGDEDEVHKLHLACEDWGFFQEILKKMKAAVAAFFELPIEEKKKYGKELQVLAPLFTRFQECNNPIEALEEYSREMQKIGEEIQANLSVLMGLKRDELKSLQGELKQGIRMNYYPTRSRPHLVLGISPHSDGTSFTLLLSKSSTMEIQSNGMYKSIEHRVITNEKKARISIATFRFPDGEQEIGPLETMIDAKTIPDCIET
ncbi:hypothetical protein Goari_026819 [Gossypium aridum]|uniref:Uncharacterized protein n=1 Tax=Gossypium aridum TaxID=34290 RepID=A0A7J8YM46_GOSAI|nr:hypothetical protein [Gossypium aridum]